jgi:hypothetical protein
MKKEKFKMKKSVQPRMDTDGHGLLRRAIQAFADFIRRVVSGPNSIAKELVSIRVHPCPSVVKIFPASLSAAVIFHFSFFILPCPAFPPAPHHEIYGNVRDQFGEPLQITTAVVRMETQSGITNSVKVIPGLAPGQNYSLTLPMDAGITADLYKPTALRPLLPFQMKVKIANTTYLPMEMSGGLRNLGQPSGRTRLDLTLGVDSDGDGLPDAWEQALLAMLGGGTLADINPGDDADGDGLTNLQEYLAGTYAFDPADGFRMELKRMNGTAPVLEFLALRGRSYSVQVSTNLVNWTSLRFRLPSEGESSSLRSTYSSGDVRYLEVEAEAQATSQKFFYRLMVQ